MPGKNTGCPAKLKFTLSGSTLHTSIRYKPSITRKCKEEYPLEILLVFAHNHSINSADALRYRPVSENCKIKFLELFSEDYTPSNATSIVSREDEITLKASFDLYKSLLPTGAFFGCGPNVGPKIAMTDDCQAEQNALSSTWESMKLLLRVFHLLQALWRWEWNSDHKIDKCDRPSLFRLFKALLYARNQDEYQEAEKRLFEDETSAKYPQYVQHIKKNILPRKEE